MSKASELSYVQNIGGQKILPDGMTIMQMRIRFQGQAKGFSELERMLDDLEFRLREQLDRQDNKAK